MSNEVAITQQFERELAPYKKHFESVLPAHIDSKKFMRTIVGAVQNNPEILKCDRQSIMLACQKAAQDGLILDNREAALVKYGASCQYQPMIDGVLKKARNSGQISVINAITVHKNDQFKYNPAMDDLPNHSPDWFGDRGEVIGVYAFAKLKDGGVAVEIMNLEEIEKIRKVSRSGTDQATGNAKGIWLQWYDQKAKVACLKRLCRRLPSSADLDQVFDHDNEGNFDLHQAEEAASEPNQASQKEKPKQTRAAQIVTAELVEDADIIDAEPEAKDDDII